MDMPDFRTAQEKEIDRLKNCVTELEFSKEFLEKDIERLRARVAELEKDRERLDWFRHNPLTIKASWHEAYAGRQVVRWSIRKGNGESTTLHRTIRQAIDAARD